MTNHNIEVDYRSKSLISKINNTKAYYPKDKTIQEIFEAQVERTPFRHAISEAGETLTYQELNEISNQIAHIIKGRGGKVNDFIGILLPHSMNLFITILGALKAGAVFVAIDPLLPLPRIKKIIADANIELIITSLPINRIRWYQGKVLNIKEIWQKAKKENKENLNLQIRPTQLACIVYTSGSTGNPKGVKIYHQGVIKCNYSLVDYFRELNQEAIPGNWAMIFSASIWQYFSPLFIGAELVVYNDEISRDPLALFKQLEKDDISILYTAPALIEAYLSDLESRQTYPKLPALKIVLLAGAELTVSLAKNYYKKFQATLVNGYGQSECGDTLHYKVPKKINSLRIPLGKPYNNIEVFILNKHLQAQPVGMTGEICFTENGLSDGYLNLREITKRAFKPHPLIKDKKIYRTGDLGKILPDGNIEFIGRSDQQVQIHGNRVEIAEIEVRLKIFPGVKKYVVIAKKSKAGEVYLAAYYTAKKRISPKNFRKFLNKHLPLYMIPSYFIYLRNIPLTANGKIDRKDLPKPNKTRDSSIEYLAPRTEIEKNLVAAWKKVLNLNRIGIKDNFLDLGGHSLQVINIVTKIKQYGYNISLANFYRNQNIYELAKFINKSYEEKTGETDCQIMTPTRGGTPFTAVRDWFLQNKITSKERLITVLCPTIDSNILAGVLQELSEIYPRLNISLSYKRKTDKALRSSQREIKIFVKDLSAKGYEINFLRHKTTINNSVFTKILKNFQYLYNLKLIGEDYCKSDISAGKLKTYTPQNSYPHYYDCWHSSITEKIRWENQGAFYSSILPALDFTCLPNYYILNNKKAWSEVSNAKALGYKDIFSQLNINGKFIKLKNKKEAYTYFQNNFQKHTPLLLIGLTYDLFFCKYYKSEKIIVAAKERRYLGLLNISLFTGSLKANPVVHSVNLKYFGKIPLLDFWKYWRGVKKRDRFKEIAKINKWEDLSPYQVVEITNINNIKSLNLERLLTRSLSLNVKEFFKSQVITGDKYSNYKKAYFGQQVLHVFKKNVVDNLRKDKLASPDIVIFDTWQRLISAWLFLKDILNDINFINQKYKQELKSINYLIKQWHIASEVLLADAKRKGLKYDFKRVILPRTSLYNISFLTEKSKNEFINRLDKILDWQGDIYNSLRIKLKNIEIKN